jgi:hypothetical protein
VNIKEIIRFVGKSEQSNEIKGFLSSLKIKQPLKRPSRGEHDVYVEVEEPPLTLLFSSEGEWKKKSQLMEGEMIFHTVFLETKAFDGDESLFPFKLNTAISRNQMRRNLGQPSWSSLAVNNDRWIVHGVRMLIDFSEDEESIESITFSINAD